jgi:hypothetical protein
VTPAVNRDRRILCGKLARWMRFPKQTFWGY